MIDLEVVFVLSVKMPASCITVLALLPIPASDNVHIMGSNHWRLVLQVAGSERIQQNR